VTAEYRLRAFSEPDFPALANLWVEAWSTTDLPIDFAARQTWLSERLKALRAEGAEAIVGLGADGLPAGFVTIDPTSGYLDQLCVAPCEFGSGLASALLDEAKSRAPGAVDLEVNEGNLRARRFYEREGFAVVSRGVSPASGLPTLTMRWVRPPPPGE
jgi:putative acetyltransferase